MIEVYLCGHGIVRVAGTDVVRPIDGTFLVPPRTEIRFYCDHNDMFDNKWESFVRDLSSSSAAVADTARSTLARFWRADRMSFKPAGTGWGSWVFEPGDECLNYRLGNPVQLVLPFKEGDNQVVPWGEFSDGELTDPGCYTVYVGHTVKGSRSAALQGTFLAKDRKMNYGRWVPLKTIVRTIRDVSDPYLLIHWLACRQHANPASDDERERQWSTYQPGTDVQAAGVPRSINVRFTG